jgi:hypothetical protein
LVDIQPLPTFTAPQTTERPCLRGNVYLHCVASCPFLAHDGTLKPGCVFYPRSLKSGETRTKEAYTKYQQPKEPIGFHYVEEDTNG